MMRATSLVLGYNNCLVYYNIFSLQVSLSQTVQLGRPRLKKSSALFPFLPSCPFLLYFVVVVVRSIVIQQQ